MKTSGRHRFGIAAMDEICLQEKFRYSPFPISPRDCRCSDTGSLFMEFEADPAEER